ncbi:MAG: phosphotransferase [Aliishimia sp.]
MPTTRLEQARAFVDKNGWSGRDLTIVAGDASNRKYYRLKDTDESVILMDAPPETGEDTKPFINISMYLEGSGLSAPRIVKADTQAGFLLIEDFGDDLFARLLERNLALESDLYEAATDVLLHLHKQRAPKLPKYDAALMSELAALSVVWYRYGATGIEDTVLAEEMQARIYALLNPLDTDAQVLIQRDYHAENLIWLPERKGVRRVGLLDFQGAMLGHPAYDLVSVLQDARRDVGHDVTQSMCTRYVKTSDRNEEDFMAAYYALGLQRNLRILGVFARLGIRDGKPQYLDLMLRVWGHIETNLNALGNRALSDFVRSCLPNPTPQFLETLRSKCPKSPPQS